MHKGSLAVLITAVCVILAYKYPIMFTLSFVLGFALFYLSYWYCQLQGYGKKIQVGGGFAISTIMWMLIGGFILSFPPAPVALYGLEAYLKDARYIKPTDFGIFDAVTAFGSFEHCATVSDRMKFMMTISNMCMIFYPMEEDSICKAWFSVRIWFPMRKLI